MFLTFYEYVKPYEELRIVWTYDKAYIKIKEPNLIHNLFYLFSILGYLYRAWGTSRYLQSWRMEFLLRETEEGPKIVSHGVIWMSYGLEVPFPLFL